MPGAPVDVGTGTIVEFETSGFSAEITNVRWGGIARNAHETSHMGTAAPAAGTFGNRTFMPGDLSNPGELTLDLHFNPQTTPPIDAAPETITVTFPKAPADATPASWSATGFVTAFELTDPFDDLMTASVTVKLTGNVAHTEAA